MSGYLDRARIRSDRGDTLLELIITVSVMGVALVAILGAFATGILMSDVHRKQATAGAAARDYAEAIQNMVAAGGYVTCGNDSYATPPGFSAPSGYVASIVQITAGRYVEYWKAGWQDDCSPDPGLQRLTVQVRSNDGADCDQASVCERILVVLRKPCRPSDAQCD